MHRKEGRKRLGKPLAFLLAAVLWTEGTLGSAWAAEAVPGAVPSGNDTQVTEEGNSRTVADEADKPAGGEVRTPENTEEPVEGEEQTPENTEEPVEGEEQTPEGTEAPDGEEPAAEETVSENTALQEEIPESEEQAAEADCALGEPPLAAAGKSASLSYYGASAADAQSQGLRRQTPGVTDIIARYEAYPWSLDRANSYSERPSTKSPYKAGHLSDGTLENALNLLNFIRYVAGIPADVTLREEYTAKAQAGALLSCVNNSLTHAPTQPEGFPDELYEEGYAGCSTSNLASGYGNIAKSLLNAWMYDGDSTNIDRMGHRRWVLNPSMKQTGFGAAGAYSAMYALDGTGAEVTDFVAWPAQNMPIELMNGSGTPWTLSLGSDYEKASIRKVSVTLRDLTSNKSWSFSGSSAKGVFKVNVEYYGMPNCIIFRPNDVSYDKNSRFQVTVAGLKDKDGQDATVSYRVNFFSLEDQPTEVEEVVLNKRTLHLLKGVEGKQEETLTAAVKPDNAADRTLTWKSTDESVATVDQKGRVTAVGVGRTEVSATAVNGEQSVCTVKVSDYSLTGDGMDYDEDTKTNSLSFDLTMEAEARRLAVQDGGRPASDQVKWVSENERVASVAADGTVTPQAVGETVVWANVEDGLVVLSCEVKVEDSRLPEMEMGEKAYTWKAGEISQIRLYFTPPDSKWVVGSRQNIRWSSDSPSVAAFVTAGADGTADAAAETVSGNVVAVTALGAGNATISATIVDKNGNAVVKDGKKAEAFCTVTVQAEAEPAQEDLPMPIALTNTQFTLGDVALPDGWRWKYPDTALAQFAGQRSKKFAAEFQPAGAGETVLPAERFLEVTFLTVEGLSVGLRSEEGEEQEMSSLAAGQKVVCYVNYSFEPVLEQFEKEHASYTGQAYYQKQKEDLLGQVRRSTTWSSSSQALSVEAAGDTAKLTAQAAGSATIKAVLKLGKATFQTGRKILVTGTGNGVLTVTEAEHFKKEEGGLAGEGERYVGLLSDFGTGNQVNSKLRVTLPGATKVTAKSSNAKVVSVKASASEGNGFTVSLAVKAAGTAQLTLTGNDEAKTSRAIRLTVADPEPGLSAETVTVNVLQTTGAALSVYPAKNPDGTVCPVTDVAMAADGKSAQFILTEEETADSYRVRAKSGIKTGTYQVKVRAGAGGAVYELPLTVKVVSKEPSYKVKQVRKLNLFYREDQSLLQIDTQEAVADVTLTGCGDYAVSPAEDQDGGGYCVKASGNATLRSVRKGSLQISFEGWQGVYTTSFAVGVEEKTPKLTLDTGRVTFYPEAGITSARIGIETSEDISWEKMEIAKVTGAKGNYTLTDREGNTFTLKGSNLNQAENVKARIILSNSTAWAAPVTCTLNIKVSAGKPAISLGNKTLQLNANSAYLGYDAVSTAVRWKNGGAVAADQGVRVSVYCDAKDRRAETLVKNSQVLFSITKKNGGYQVAARLNNRAVEPGTYKYIVQAAKDGQIWKTPLTLKVVDAGPGEAVKITAKGSIDVLDRDGSFMTLTPSLKALGGDFVIPADREVKLTGRDAHLFRAVWSVDGKTIELRAKRGETLVARYQYTVTPVLTLENGNGETRKIRTPAVKCKVKQGSVKVNASPKIALVYSGAYNAVEIDMKAVLKGASAPEIERVTLTGNTDAFRFVYNKDGKGTLIMRDTGSAVKGKSYSLQFQVLLAEQADNVKPVTVRYTVKVK